MASDPEAAKNDGPKTTLHLCKFEFDYIFISQTDTAYPASLEMSITAKSFNIAHKKQASSPILHLCKFLFAYV